MNRFRSRKKSVGDGGEGSRRPSIDNETVPALPSSFSSRTFRRKKVATPEPKPEIDLSTALPDTNDFRTSLLMPNLSARFSMLREQDDPMSKIGKANDDSVLFPKRASRLDLFNNRQQGLSDIAEVDSLRGSLRPPFTQARVDSFASDGYGTDGEGSVMSRSRPGEGNTMFGGRQKIYKIPVGQSGSVKNFGSGEEGELPSGRNMGGKALYESDTLPSAFQILREQERQDREKAGAELANARSSNDNDRSGSPPMPRYNRNRETSSSTTSGPSQSRTSTAATSIASQKSIYGAHEALNGFNHGTGPASQPNSASSDRPFPRAKKLYGQGLEQNQHDAQSSSLQRINSLNRGRGGVVGRGLGPSRSASNLRDGYRGGYMPGGPLYSAGGYRSGSPTPSNTQSKMQDFDLGLNENMSPISTGQDSGYGASPQLFSHTSPPISPNLNPTSPDPTLGAALEPNDVGKATASGAFNKPKKQYDEQQYLKRQLQLHEGRNTPSPGPGAVGRSFSPPQGLFHEPTVGRSRNNSQTSGLSRSNSIMHAWEHQMEDRKMRTVTERGRSTSTSRDSEEPTIPAMERSFFSGQSGSEIGESESDADPASPVPSNTGFHSPRPRVSPSATENANDISSRPIGLQAPLNFAREPQYLSQPQDDLASDSRSYRSETTVTQLHETPHHSIPLSDSNPTISVPADSPTLGPVGVSNDLSGMVRQHLRNVSGTSSVYPEDSPARRRSSRPDIRESIFGHGSALDEQEWKDEISHDDHWVRRASQKRESEDIPPLPQPLHFAARQMLEQAQAHKAKQTTGNDKAQRVLGGEAPRAAQGAQDTELYRQEQPRLRHTRGPSTDTQRTGSDKAQRILGGEAPRPTAEGVDPNTPWQDQVKSNHARGPSTETQMERESLANELEARKRAVRSNLQTFTEGQSRDASPAPSAGARTKDNSPAKPVHPFSILKKSSSRSAMERAPGKQENPSKAMKMLGIDPNAAPGDADGPPAGLFMGREQFSDRAMPPNAKIPRQQPQDVRPNFDDESPSKIQRALFGSRSRPTTERPSPSSSKTGSSFSDSSDRHPTSRKGSKEKAILERSPADGFAPNGAGQAENESSNVPQPPAIPTSRSTRGSPVKGRSRSVSRLRSRSNSKSNPPSHFEQAPRVAPPGTPVMINPAKGNRSAINGNPYSANSPPPLHDHPSNHPTAQHPPMTHPTMINPHPPTSPRTQQNFASRFNSMNNRNRTINKNDISEPTFLSCTSSVDTVSLPPGASLSNGMDSRSQNEQHDVPPVPQRDSRRKRTLLAALSGRKSPQETVSAISSPIQTSFPQSVSPPENTRDEYEDRSPLSGDDEPTSPDNANPNPGSRRVFDQSRLRKTSSEGGNMNQRARLQALQEVRPGLPYRGPGDVDGNEAVVGAGEHVQYQAERDVPASAVMF